MFACDKCGMCCRNLNRSPLYIDLDRGDGTCVYLDEITNLCRIYSRRPEKCNVDLIYEKYFKEVISLEEFYMLNYEACKDYKGEK